jgi:hypothetical protein
MLGLSAGQILFKLGAERLERDGAPTAIPFLNAPIVIALVIYVVSTMYWISALRALPLPCLPGIGAGLCRRSVLGHFFLNEQLGIRSLVGDRIAATSMRLSMLVTTQHGAM